MVALYENGKKVVGEHSIDEPRHNGKLRIKNLFLEPKVKAYQKAIEVILKADAVIIGPGDLYTSLIPNLVVEGIPEALKKTKAKVMYILNLMTRFGQTYSFSAKDHVKALEQYLGRKCLDFVLVNSKHISEEALLKYKKGQEFSVKDDLKDDYFKVVRADFLSKKEVKKIPGDSLKRSLIRHDSDKLTKTIIKILSL